MKTKTPVAMGVLPSPLFKYLKMRPTAKATVWSNSSTGIEEPKLWNWRVVGEWGTWYEMKFREGARVLLGKPAEGVSLRFDLP